MKVLIFLIAIALLVFFLSLTLLLWFIKNDQFEDLERARSQIFFDDD